VSRDLRDHGAAVVGDVHVNGPVVGIHDDDNDLAVGVHERSGVEVLRVERKVGTEANATGNEIPRNLPDIVIGRLFHHLPVKDDDRRLTRVNSIHIVLERAPHALAIVDEHCIPLNETFGPHIEVVNHIIRECLAFRPVLLSSVAFSSLGKQEVLGGIEVVGGLDIVEVRLRGVPMESNTEKIFRHIWIAIKCLCPREDVVSVVVIAQNVDAWMICSKRGTQRALNVISLHLRIVHTTWIVCRTIFRLVLWCYSPNWNARAIVRINKLRHVVGHGLIVLGLQISSAVHSPICFHPARWAPGSSDELDLMTALLIRLLNKRQDHLVVVCGGEMGEARVARGIVVGMHREGVIARADGDSS